MRLSPIGFSIALRTRGNWDRLLVVAAIIFSLGTDAALYGQTNSWTGGPTGPIYYTGGNVGIGTTNPPNPFYVAGSTTASSNWGQITAGNAAGSHWISLGYDDTSHVGFITALRVGTAYDPLILQADGGNVGIGTTSPGASLDIAGTSITALRINGTTANTGSNNTQLRFAGGTQGDLWAIGTDLTTNNGSKQFQFYDLKANIVPLTLQQGTGNIGIGTTNPTQKLSVAGNIQAYGITVQTGWSDYVFAPNYRLAPLSEVAAYIEQNHHLPDIPSAAEVTKNGVSLGDMQAKLLAKIEELTLHMIQADEKSNRLELQNSELRREIDELKLFKGNRDE